MLDLDRFFFGDQYIFSVGRLSVYIYGMGSMDGVGLGWVAYVVFFLVWSYFSSSAMAFGAMYVHTYSRQST